MESYKIENLTFKYPASEKKALDGISLDIKKGEFITICGKSGCGKTTLLRLLKPTLSPTGERGGRVFFENKILESLSEREQCEKIGFVMQNPDNQIVTDKVWHELAFGLESLGLKNSEIRARVAEMASFFGIEEWFHKKVTELSGGQKQLLNLASVMVMQPSVLILDEPTSQLDPIASQEFLEAVAKINRELGVTVILCEHRLEDALPLSDRVLVMDNGKAVLCTSPKEAAYILKSQNNPMLAAMPTAMRVFAEVDNRKISPVTIREGRAWLSDYFKDKLPLKIVKENYHSEEECAVELADVHFRYEKESPDILRGLSLKINRGEFYAILGGNGSGKTTMLSLISGNNKPYRGKVNIGGKDLRISALPQNPQALFVEKTVEKDMWEMLSDVKLPRDEKQKLIYDTMELCELTDLSKRHPYDLSGGEMQRAALCKVLLHSPDILLLDEPTKGLDAHFKKKLASILISLKKSGVTVVMVSHDVEFCCEYTDKCAMFFDGIIVSEDIPHRFFSGKSFYTTAANRMSRGIIENAVLTKDIIHACGVITDDEIINIKKSSYYDKPKPENKEVPKKNSVFKIITGIFSLLTAICIIIFLNDKYTDWRMYGIHTATLILLAIAFNYLIPQKELGGVYSVQAPKEERKISRSTLWGIAVLLILIPLTIFIGKVYLGDRKYYFISLLIIIEIMLPFLLAFEKKKPTAREVVVLSVLCAMAVLGRMAFFMLPQFKPMAAIIIITGVCFGAESGFLVGAVSMFVSNFFFSQGPWTPWQMFGFGVVGFISGLLFKKGLLRKTRGSMCIFSVIAVVVFYGVILNIGSVIMYTSPTKDLILSALALGLPLDVIHGVSTAFFLYTCAPEMIEKLERIKSKYGLTLGR